MTLTVPPIWPPLGSVDAPLSALGAGVVAVLAAGLGLVAPPLQAAAPMATAARNPAPRLHRNVFSSMSVLLSLIIGPVVRAVSWAV